MSVPFELLLPLLDGWSYAGYSWSGVVEKGKKILIVAEEKYSGILLSMCFMTNDAYCGIEGIFGGPKTLFPFKVTPQSAYDMGAVQQDPTGWVQLYDRPNSASTAGKYVVVPFSGGFQGFPMSYAPPVKIYAFLEAESTQPAAALHFSTINIIITDKEAYLKSLREILGLPSVGKLV